MRKLFYIFFFFSVAAYSRPGGTLSGGLLFPASPIAALTNAAAITSEWGKEARAQYSPPLKSDTPHSYLAGFAASSGILGINLGYSGSYQNGSAIHNAFGGLSYRFRSFSLGVALRQSNILGSGHLAGDLSFIWYFLRRIRIAAVAYNVTENKQVALGMGLLLPKDIDLNADILFPLSSGNQLVADEYSATGALLFYTRWVGFSVASRYRRAPIYQEDEKPLRFMAGTLVRISRNFSLVAEGESSPNCISLSLIWNDYPTTKQYVEFFLNKNRAGSKGSSQGGVK